MDQTSSPKLSATASVFDDLILSENPFQLNLLDSFLLLNQMKYASVALDFLILP